MCRCDSFSIDFAGVWWTFQLLSRLSLQLRLCFFTSFIAYCFFSIDLISVLQNLGSLHPLIIFCLAVCCLCVFCNCTLEELLCLDILLIWGSAVLFLLLPGFSVYFNCTDAYLVSSQSFYSSPTSMFTSACFLLLAFCSCFIEAALSCIMLHLYLSWCFLWHLMLEISEIYSSFQPSEDTFALDNPFHSLTVRIFPPHPQMRHIYPGFQTSALLLEQLDWSEMGFAPVLIHWLFDTLNP